MTYNVFNYVDKPNIAYRHIEVGGLTHVFPYVLSETQEGYFHNEKMAYDRVLKATSQSIT